MLLVKNVTHLIWGQWLKSALSLQWRHNERDGISNHQPHDCLLKRLFRRRSNKTSKLRVIGLCEGNSPVTGEFPAQRASNAESASIWWRHHDERWWPGAVLSWLQLVEHQQPSWQPKTFASRIITERWWIIENGVCEIICEPFFFWSPWFKSAMWILKAWCSVYLAPWHQHDDNTQMKMSPATWEPFCFGSMI